MLELQHISYETEENREILHDISLTIADRFVAITGPNGGGKSTLAKIIAGIYTPTAGRLLLDGEEALDALCPACRAEAREGRCPVCGAATGGDRTGENAGFDPERFERMRRGGKE